MGGLAHNVQKPPPRKNVQKPPPRKNRFEPEKSQGQIFQECQGQMPRSNPKVKWENKNGKPEKNRKKMVLTGKNGKNGKWKNGKV